MLVMHAGLKLSEGDIASVAIHAPDREEAKDVLLARGWIPAGRATVSSRVGDAPP